MNKPSKSISQTFVKAKNQHYLNFIVKNHLKIEQTSNYNFRKIIQANISPEKQKKAFAVDLVNSEQSPPNLFIGSAQRYQSQTNSSSDKFITYDKLMEIIKVKNKEIAQQLIKERKNMGDIVYSIKDNKYQSLDKALNIKRKQQQQFSIKFPQLIKKKLTNLQTKTKTIQIGHEKLKRYSNVQITEQKDDKHHKIIHLQNKTNQKVLDAYYKSQCYLQLKEQTSSVIPIFQSPKYSIKKDKSKQKNKPAINAKIKEEYQKRDQKSQQYNKYFKANTKIIESTRITKVLKNEDKISEQLNKEENVKDFEDDQKINQKHQIIIQNEQTQLYQKKQEQEQQKQQQNEKGNLVKKIKKHHSQQLNLQKPNAVLHFLRQDGTPNIYQIKIKQYRQFLFLMNLAHRKFDQLLLTEQRAQYKNQYKYKYYVGKGNNSLLIKSLLNRRFWWVEQHDVRKANFVWTQLKFSQLYHYQQKSQTKNNFENVQIVTKKKKKTKEIKIQNKVKMGVFKPPLPQNKAKILTQIDLKYYELIQNANSENLQDYNNRLKYLPKNLLSHTQNDKSEIKMHNHFQFNYFLGNKKALLYNLKQYYELLGKDVFTIIPLTFHIKTGITDPQYQGFVNQYHKNKNINKNIWIVKPGELSNRGNGITVINSINQVNKIVKRKQKHQNGSEKTYIIQQYIEKPLLYKGRKFDIRHYLIVSRLHGRMRAYWYGQGYIRTSSQQFCLDQIDNQFMHLTNDAIQKYAHTYGKFQEANKLSYNQFQRYLDVNFSDKKISFAETIYPKMKSIALDTFIASYIKIDPNVYQHNFEVFGLDFMVDSQFNVWLIEVNTNPCLEINCPILNRIIPTMLQHTFRLTLDVIFPPTAQYPHSQKHLAPESPLERLLFELIFDEGRDGEKLNELYENVKIVQINNIQDEDEVYQNDGQCLKEDEQID